MQFIYQSSSPQYNFFNQQGEFLTNWHVNQKTMALNSNFFSWLQVNQNKVYNLTGNFSLWNTSSTTYLSTLSFNESLNNLFYNQSFNLAWYN